MEVISVMKYDPQSIYSEIQQLLQQSLMPATYDGWFRDMRALDVLEKDHQNIQILESENSLAKRLIT